MQTLRPTSRRPPTDGQIALGGELKPGHSKAQPLSGRSDWSPRTVSEERHQARPALWQRLPDSRDSGDTTIPLLDRSMHLVCLTSKSLKSSHKTFSESTRRCTVKTTGIHPDPRKMFNKTSLAMARSCTCAEQELAGRAPPCGTARGWS